MEVWVFKNNPNETITDLSTWERTSNPSSEVGFQWVVKHFTRNGLCIIFYAQGCPNTWKKLQMLHLISLKTHMQLIYGRGVSKKMWHTSTDVCPSSFTENINI